MRVKRVLGGTAAAAAIAGMGMTGVAQARTAPEQPAQPVAQQVTVAKKAPGACAKYPGYLCFWMNRNYKGTMGKVAGDNRDFRTFRNNKCTYKTWDDCVSSAFNNGRKCTVYLYPYLDWKGSPHSLRRGDGTPDMYKGWFDNKLSSNKWCRKR